MLRKSARKAAGIFFTLALIFILAFAYVALVFHGDISVGADYVVEMSFGAWITLFSFLLALCLLVLLILFLSRTEQTSADQARVGNEVTIECRDCHKEYVITDTGDRPLLHACPHCGFTDSYPPEDLPAMEQVEQPVPVATSFYTPDPSKPEALVIHCTSCGSNFETGYTTERPLVLNCSNCGKRGILRPNAPTHPAWDPERGPTSSQ